MDLQLKLSSIGIDVPADRIRISDEDSGQIRVKLYASSPEEAHLLSLLTPDQTISEANLCSEMLLRANQKGLTGLRTCLVNGAYRQLSEFVDASKQVFAQAAKRDIKAEALARFETDPNIRLVMELLGQRVLHTDFDLGLSDIPLGMHLYFLGTTESRDRFNSIESVRPENFGGSIVALEPIDLGKDGIRTLAEDEAPRATGEKLTFEELLQETITEDEALGGMQL